jgi:hypothetical protein
VVVSFSVVEFSDLASPALEKVVAAVESEPPADALLRVLASVEVSIVFVVVIEAALHKS